MKRVRLGDVCQVISGATPKSGNPAFWGGEIPWVTPAELDDDSHLICKTERCLTEAGFKSASLHMMPVGTVLLSTRAPIGKTAITGIEMCCNQGFKNLVCGDEISNEYLYRFLKSNTTALQARGRGATFKELSKREVERFLIPLPSLERQRECTSKLEAIENEIKQAKAQSTSLDELVKARLVEMFGDGEFPTSKLADCVESIDTGKSPKCSSTPRSGGKPAVLKLSAISSGTYLETENKELLAGESVVPGKEVSQGDILLARKNTPELVGKSVYVSSTGGNIMFPDIVFRMHPLSIINAIYLSHLLAGPLFDSIRDLAHGSAKSMSNIPKTELAKLPIPIPPLPLQQEFAAFVAQVDQLKADTQLAIDKLQMLYDSLAQEYFSE